jgi:hypothetical protein
MSAYRIMTPAVVRSALFAAGIGLVPGIGSAQEIVPYPRADRLTVVVRAQLVAAGGDSLAAKGCRTNPENIGFATRTWVRRHASPDAHTDLVVTTGYARDAHPVFLGGHTDGMI